MLNEDIENNEGQRAIDIENDMKREKLMESMEREKGMTESKKKKRE